MADGSNDCGNGSSCPSDNKCARNGKHCLAQDAIDCGNHYCGAGAKCGTGNQCLARDAVDCGKGRSCSAGSVCMPGGSCITREQLTQRVEDEKKRKAEEERRAKEAKEAEELAKKEKLRLAQEEARKKVEAEREAARQKEEQRRTAEAQKKAEAEAKQKAELEARQKAEAAKRAAAEAEVRRRAEEERRAKEAKEAEELAKKEKVRLAQEEARKKAETERDAARQKEEQRHLAEAQKKAEAEAKQKDELEAKQQAEAAKRAAAEAEARRKADELAAAKVQKQQQEADRAKKEADAKFDKELDATARDPKQSQAVRAIAAIALGKDPSSFGIPNLRPNTQGTPKPLTQAEREIAMIALGKGDKASLGQNQTSPSAQGKLRAVLEDPQQSAAAREIAAIALGNDKSSSKPSTPTPPSAQPPATGQGTASTNPTVASPKQASEAPASGSKIATAANDHSYTFKKTSYGTVQIADHGKVIATTTPELAASRYGYDAPKSAPSTAASPTASPSAVSPTSSSSAVQKQVVAPKQANNLWSSLEKSAGATATKSQKQQTDQSKNQAQFSSLISDNPAKNKSTFQTAQTTATLINDSAKRQSATGASPLSQLFKPTYNKVTADVSIDGQRTKDIGKPADSSKDKNVWKGSIGVTATATYNAVDFSVQRANIKASIDFANVTGSVRVSANLKGVSAEASAQASAAHGEASLGLGKSTTSIAGDALIAEAHAGASAGVKGVSVGAGASALIAKGRLTEALDVGPIKVDVYAEAGLGPAVGADAKLKLNSGKIDIAPAVGELGIGFDITSN